MRTLIQKKTMQILFGTAALPYKERTKTLLLAHDRCFNTAIHAAENMTGNSHVATEPQHVIAVHNGTVLAVLSIRLIYGTVIPCHQIDDLLIMQTNGTHALHMKAIAAALLAKATSLVHHGAVLVASALPLYRGWYDQAGFEACHEVMHADTPVNTVMVWRETAFKSIQLLRMARLVDARNREARPRIYACQTRDCWSYGVYACPMVSSKRLSVFVHSLFPFILPLFVCMCRYQREPQRHCQVRHNIANAIKQTHVYKLYMHIFGCRGARLGSVAESATKPTLAGTTSTHAAR